MDSHDVDPHLVQMICNRITQEIYQLIHAMEGDPNWRTKAAESANKAGVVYYGAEDPETKAS